MRRKTASMPTPPVTTLSLSAHDELYIIDLDKVIYMHIPHVKEQFIRLGRKYIINLRLIFRISTIKETLSLTDAHNGTIEIHVSKPVLRSLIELMKQ